MSTGGIRGDGGRTAEQVRSNTSTLISDDYQCRTKVEAYQCSCFAKAYKASDNYTLLKTQRLFTQFATPGRSLVHTQDYNSFFSSFPISGWICWNVLCGICECENTSLEFHCKPLSEQDSRAICQTEVNGRGSAGGAVQLLSQREGSRGACTLCCEGAKKNTYAFKGRSSGSPRCIVPLWAVVLKAACVSRRLWSSNWLPCRQKWSSWGRRRSQKSRAALAPSSKISRLSKHQKYTHTQTLHGNLKQKDHSFKWCCYEMCC